MIPSPNSNSITRTSWRPIPLVNRRPFMPPGPTRGFGSAIWHHRGSVAAADDVLALGLRDVDPQPLRGEAEALHVHHLGVGGLQRLGHRDHAVRAPGGVVEAVAGHGYFTRPLPRGRDDWLVPKVP